MSAHYLTNKRRCAASVKLYTSNL